MISPREALLLLAVLIAGTVMAQSLYRYRDEQGNWVYTDRKPDTVRDVQVEQRAAGSRSFNALPTSSRC